MAGWEAVMFHGCCLPINGVTVIIPIGGSDW